METPQAATAAAPASTTSPADQARIRRERRQAKLKAEGASRLSRITATQSSSKLREDARAMAPDSPGTPTAEPSPLSRTASVKKAPPSEPRKTEPPSEPELSQHYYKPQPQSQSQPRAAAPKPAAGSPLAIDEDPFAGPSESQMREIMAYYGQAGGGGRGGVKGPGQADTEIPDDPMLAMLQQMMGLPPMGAGGVPGMGTGQQPQEQEKWAAWWSVLHTVCALLLAVWSIGGLGWLAGITGYGGAGESEGLAEAEKEEGGMLSSMSFSSKVLYAFSTMELILQSSRFVIEKGRPPPGSILSMVGQALPPPFGTYLITIARYSVIWTTIINDAMLIIFVVGIWSWWMS